MPVRLACLGCTHWQAEESSRENSASFPGFWLAIIIVFKDKLTENLSLVGEKLGNSFGSKGEHFIKSVLIERV